VPLPDRTQEPEMAKKRRTGNREMKKPKQIKPKNIEANSISQVMQSNNGKKAK
jgi:hypothetical protein